MSNIKVKTGLIRVSIFLLVLTGIMMRGVLPTASADETPTKSENLLINGKLEQCKGQEVPGWTFNRNKPEGKVEWGVEQGKSGQNCLFIRKLDRGTHDHVWWQQTVEVNEGQKYHLTFQAKGFGETDYGVIAGMAFLGDEGKWLDFIQIVSVSQRSTKWPASNKEEIREWKTFEGNGTPPRGTRKIVLRLDLDASSPGEAYFQDISLTIPSQTVAQVLEMAPVQIPIYSIPLQPVSAVGVTLTPNWNLQGAETWESQSRSRICLNGLWAIQPANGYAPPRENDWAFMKVPGWLELHHPYLVYGQDQTSWAKTDIGKDARAVWYLRDLEMPALKGRKSFLNFSGLRGLSLRIYWNGKPVGILTDQLGGRMDLTSVIRPGEKGQLALYALATKPEGKYAFLMEAGKIARLYDANDLKKDSNRGLLDVYLDTEPAQPVFSRTDAVPSVRKRELAIRIIALEKVDPSSLVYAVAVNTPDGKAVQEKTGLHGKMQDGKFVVNFPWNDAHLWNPDDPYLYQFQIRALDEKGRILDETLPERFGFREVWVQGRNLMLNGQPLRLRPRLSNTMFLDTASVRREFSFMKDIGFNCVLRPTACTTHELEGWWLESPDSYYRTADEMGMLVLPYTPYNLISGGQFGDAGIKLDQNLLMQYVDKHQIARLANHPSVIAYSGFGAGYTEGINYVNIRPDIWGVTPLGNPGVLEKILSDSSARTKAAKTIAASRDFINDVKRLDTSRPFLSHYDDGEGDGSGIFDYFNWTPTQEWEEWPALWAKQGVKPIGSTEHGLPYPASFVNHGIPGGDAEPWVTEYSAMVLGPQAYSREPAEYLQFIRSTYNKITQTYNTNAHKSGSEAVAKNRENVQSVWAVKNKAIYRAWRTYGLPMGIEPFGHSSQFVKKEELMKGDGQIVANKLEDLRTVGAKLDKWFFNSYWPSQTMPRLPTAPTGRIPDALEPLGKTLHEVNSPFLAYIAGDPIRFTAKDHVFWSGEVVTKQIALVWDGFRPLELSVEWNAVLNGKTIGGGKENVTLNGGEIRMLPITFSATASSEREEGSIQMSVRGPDKNQVLSEDVFAFQVYTPCQASADIKRRKIALLDPSGESLAAFERLGLNPTRIGRLDELKGFDLLTIGRDALPSLAGQSIDQLPSGIPVLVLEQSVKNLEKLGFTAFPSRNRTVFPLPVPHPALQGVRTSELCDWRISPKLLPEGVEPLRDNYNYHTGYYGTVASVTIETPTRGNFTPLLQCGFDLRETPLLEATLDGRRWMFCQLSLLDGLPQAPGLKGSSNTGDPVATRILSNLLDYIVGNVETQVHYGVLGDSSDLSLIQETGASVKDSSSIDQLEGLKVAVIGKTNADTSRLKAWVENGGMALVLPQEKEFYQACLSGTAVTSKNTSLPPPPTNSQTRIFSGIGEGDFHYRQPLPLLTFEGGADVAEIPSGKGRWILIGFDPRRLNLSDEPYLRLTYRHQFRVLSQILTNLGVPLELPMKSVLKKAASASFKVDISAIGKAVMLEKANSIPKEWLDPGFDDKGWMSFALATKRTPYGHACVRIRFMVPETTNPQELVADLGTMDDYDETYLNGIKLGSVNPANSSPDTAWSTRRIYPIPSGLLKPDKENVLAIYAWNRNAESKGWVTQVRGPLIIRPADAGLTPYVGAYKHSDDPYLQHHW